MGRRRCKRGCERCGYTEQGGGGTGQPADSLTIGLAGNPNCGKTTLFNALTGERLKTANWPGVTVERMEGIAYYKGRAVHIVDLPGIYSLSSYTMEERITKACLEDPGLHLIVNVADASCLERSLFLTLQLLRCRQPVLLALNMMDAAKRKGIAIRTDSLSRMLGGIPVIPVSARKRDGIDRLLKEAVAAAKAGRKAKPERQAEPEDAAFFAGDGYGYIEEILSECVVQIGKTARDRAACTFSADRVLTHPVWGIPAFLLIMAVVFFLTFYVGDALHGFLDSGLTFVSGGLRSVLIKAHSPDWFLSLIVDGIVAGVGGVLTFFPNLFILFLALAVLEDSGYMARAAYVMNEIMGAAGLSGRAFLPLLLGFGCSVPAVMASRTLETVKDKRRTILMTPFMSCSAKLPIYILFSGMFFPEYAAAAAILLYTAGVTAAVMAGAALRAANPGKNQEGSGFLLIELPEYRLPDGRTILSSVWEREKEYLVKAGTVICSASVLMWILLHTGRAGFCTELSESFGAVLGGWMAPLLRPAGLGSWQTAVALLSGLTAKEVVVSSFFVLYGIPDIAAAGGGRAVRLASALRETGFGAANACALMVFCLFYPPCMAALSVICKESDSFLWTVGMVLLELMIAWAAAVAVFQAGSLAFG